MEVDGFQADTEDDDDEDCILIPTQNGELGKRSQIVIFIHV